MAEDVFNSASRDLGANPDEVIAPADRAGVEEPPACMSHFPILRGGWPNGVPEQPDLLDRFPDEGAPEENRGPAVALDGLIALTL